jgi:hypothetical protein
MGWPGRAQRPKPPLIAAGRHQSSRSLRCTPIRSRQMRSPRSASTSVRARSTSSVSTSAAPSCCRSSYQRIQLERRLANVPCRLVGMEAGCGSHHIARQIRALGHDVRLIPAQYVKPFLNETATYCSPTRDRGADHLSISSAVRGDRSHFKAIRLSRRRGGRYSAS